MNELKIRYIADIDHIKPIQQGDWIDLRCAEDITMKQGEYKLIPLGVAMQLPHGFETIVAPRSSTYKKYGIIMVNSIGIIDESYCGNDDQWCFPALAMRDTEIKKNERICQFRLLWHQQKHPIIEVKELSNNNRGGFGSTGVM